MNKDPEMESTWPVFKGKERKLEIPLSRLETALHAKLRSLFPVAPVQALSGTGEILAFI